MRERRLTRALVRAPGQSLVSGLTTANLGAPNYALALEQHAVYCEALEACGLTVTHLPRDERYPDSTFVEDTAVIISPRGSEAGRASAVLTRPGAESRTGEVISMEPVLSELFGQTLIITEPGTVDGGDILQAGDHFFIGISDRTNDEGGAQLAEFLKSFEYTSSFVDIRNVENILHLKSGISYLGDNRLAVWNAFGQRPEFDGYELLRIGSGEEYAANCVAINDSVLIAAGFPQFESTLKSLGYETRALQMSEFQKLDGGLSCLSLRW